MTALQYSAGVLHTAGSCLTPLDQSRPGYRIVNLQRTALVWKHWPTDYGFSDQLPQRYSSDVRVRRPMGQPVWTEIKKNRPTRAA